MTKWIEKISGVKVSCLEWTGVNVDEMKEFTGVEHIAENSRFSFRNYHDSPYKCEVSEYMIKFVGGLDVHTLKELTDRYTRK